MRIIKVILLDDEQAQVTPEKVYMGEHRAARLEISLPQRLRTGFDYYSLCFDVMGAGKRVPLGNIYEAGPGGGKPESLAWMENGEIVCELPESLTQCSFIRVQVEACREEDGVCTRLEKSVPFRIAFEDSIAGEGGALSALAQGHMTKLMARFNRLRRALRAQLQGMQDLLTRRLLAENTDYTASVSDKTQSSFYPGQSYSVNFGGYQLTLLEDHWYQNDYVPQPISDWIEGLQVAFSRIGADQDITLTPNNAYVLEDYASFTLPHTAQNGDIFEFFCEITNDWNGLSTQFSIRFISYTPDDPNDVNDTVALDAFAWETEDFTETKNLGQLLTLELENPATALDSFDIQLSGSIAEVETGKIISPFGLHFRAAIGSNGVELLQGTQGVGAFAIVRVQAAEDNGALVLFFDATPSLGSYSALSNIQVQQVVRTGVVKNEAGTV